MNIGNAGVTAMPDVQSSADVRQVVIARVGVKSVRHPLEVQLSERSQSTIGLWDMYVRLPEDKKGTHMSRFMAMLENRQGALSMAGFQAMIHQMLALLEADSGYINVVFPYFVRKTAPVSGVQSLMDYQVSLNGEVTGGHLVMRVKVVVPVTSLCPCSKQISAYGAHNQRSHITVDAELDGPLDVDALIAAIEGQASCEVYGLLKRPDEKYVTERAYENPKFVEDLVRDVAVMLRSQPSICAYTLEAENFESIHNHSAYALIEYRRD